MMNHDVFQINRYELKYLVTEKQAVMIRDYIRHFCRPDPNTDPVTCMYIVNNLYFDTPDLQFYYDTRFRKVNRFKPRARYYHLRPECIYTEIKYRFNNVTWKTRKRLQVAEWPSLFQPQLAGRVDPVCRPVAETFLDVINLYHAEPVLQVRYEREAYVTELENYGRVTFDRKLSSRLANGGIDLGRAEDYVFYDDAQTAKFYESMVILELKVEMNVPAWVVNLVSRFDLKQTGFSKYCNGIDCHLGYRAACHRGFQRRSP